MSLVSVIIPVYNGERFIRETIQSVLDQTFQDFELIISDDGSTDSTPEIVSSFKDHRVIFFPSSHTNASAARNRGIARAAGQYVAFIDADDLWASEKIEKQLKAFNENPQAAIAYSWTDYIDEKGVFIRRGSCRTFSGHVYEELLLMDFIENGSNPLIRIDALKKIGGFDESLSAAQDLDMWLRLAFTYDFAVVPSVQVFYRLSSSTVSSDPVNYAKNWIIVIERAFSKTPQSLQYLKKVSYVNRYLCLVYDALKKNPGHPKPFLAFTFLLKVIRHQPALLREREIFKALLKISLVMVFVCLLSRAQIYCCLQRFFDAERLFAYVRMTPEEAV